MTWKPAIGQLPGSVHKLVRLATFIAGGRKSRITNLFSSQYENPSPLCHRQTEGSTRGTATEEAVRHRPRPVCS